MQLNTGSGGVDGALVARTVVLDRVAQTVQVSMKRRNSGCQCVPGTGTLFTKKDQHLQVTATGRVGANTLGPHKRSINRMYSMTSAHKAAQYNQVSLHGGFRAHGLRRCFLLHDDMMMFPPHTLPGVFTFFAARTGSIQKSMLQQAIIIVLLLLLLLVVATAVHIKPTAAATSSMFTTTTTTTMIREGVHRFDAVYANALASTLHAPLPPPSVLPPIASGGSTTFLGVPPPAAEKDDGTIIFEHRPFLANATTQQQSLVVVIADRPMSPRRLPVGSQKRIVVSSPVYLAQFDRADRLRVLRNCARWLHPSQGILVLRFLDGGAGLKKWTQQQQQQGPSNHYRCRATLACGTDDQGCGAWHITEELREKGTTTTTTTRYSSLLFVDALSVWAMQVLRAGLEVMHQVDDKDDEEDGEVVWICRVAV